MIRNKYHVAVEFRGSMYRTLNGKRHCDTGPAVTFKHGYCEYWVDGEYMSQGHHKEYRDWVHKKYIKLKKNNPGKLLKTIYILWNIVTEYRETWEDLAKHGIK